MKYYKFLKLEDDYLVWKTIQTSYLESKDALFLWKYLFISSKLIDSLTESPGVILCLVEEPTIGNSRLTDNHHLQLKIIRAWRWKKEDFIALTRIALKEYQLFWEREGEIGVGIKDAVEMIVQLTRKKIDYDVALATKDFLDDIMMWACEERGFYSNAETMKENINNWMLTRLSQLEKVNLEDLNIKVGDLF